MNDIIENIKEVINSEALAIKGLNNQISISYVKAIELIEKCTGKVVVTGVGKSGHIGKKIAATLSSTGTPAFFIHSTEGIHGDLGMIEENDVVILISNSGETDEVLSLLPSLKKMQTKLIVITSNECSSLAQYSDAVLAYQYDGEADPLGLAPTNSSTISLVIGDALAVTLSKRKHFTEENFHLYHPGGSLGERIATKKSNIEKL